MRPYKYAIVGLVGVLTIFAAAYSIQTITATVPAMANYTTLPTIIIDPGHGGIDGGAVGVDDIVEKDINLAICLTMRDFFVASGFDVVMTRESDVSIHDEGVTGVRRQKTSDLHNRMAIMEEHPGAIFLSIHQNKFSESSSRGTQIFYGPNNPQSTALAEALQQGFVKNLQPENTRATKKAGENLYLMYNAQCPAVLVECGFLSNRDEAYLLTDPEYQAKIAFTIYLSVMDFLELDLPAVSPDAEQTETLEPIL